MDEPFELMLQKYQKIYPAFDQIREALAISFGPEDIERAIQISKDLRAQKKLEEEEEKIRQ